MNEQNKIPSEIASIIERKKQALLEERQRDEEQKQRKLEEAQLQGQVKFNEYLQESILKTPEWIRPYLDLTFDEVDYERIASGWDRVEKIDLCFSIPGLAVIEFQPKDNSWRCQSAGWNPGYDNDQPYLLFNNYSYWHSDVEFVLESAQSEMQEYEGYLSEYVTEQEERARRQEHNAQLEKNQGAYEAEHTVRKELEHQKEQAEEHALFDAIKHDSIAIHMLKAFVLLRDERSTFEQRLYEADETMSDIENRWSRKAADLRRQADEIERKAADEKARLQSNLEDVEAKLKKTEQSW